jgi:hypothetical protein
MMVNKLVETSRLEKLAGILWGLLLVALPFTSFRYLPSFMGHTQVRPLALFPLALLLPSLLVLAWRKRKLNLPAVVLPLVAFMLFAFIGTVLGGLPEPLEWRGHTYWERAFRGWVSLGLGISFFLTALWMNRTTDDLKRSLKWLYIGLTLTLFWGGVQVLAISTPIVDVGVIDQIQKVFSIRGLVLGRISGFAYEPSWLADQLVILFSPWLFAATLTGYRLTNRKWLEPVLMVLVVVLVVFTYSRSGLSNLFISVVVISVITGRVWIKNLLSWFFSPFRSNDSPAGKVSAGPKALRIVITILLLLCFAVVLYLLFNQPYFAQLFEFRDNFLRYIISNSGGPRLAYAYAGLKTYGESPWVGVGLSASGFFMMEYIPDWSRTVTEIARLISPDSTIMLNTKNLYVRLLSETGLIGFWLYIGFYLAVLGCVRKLLVAAEPPYSFIGKASFFIWLSVGVRNLTQDSLTSPLMWISLGMVVGLANGIPSRLLGGDVRRGQGDNDLEV